MTLRICLDCSRRHRVDGPRCRPCYLEHQKARNEARKALYGGTWRATSKRARAAIGQCVRCGRTNHLSLDHETGMVECQSCNSSHRRNPGSET